MSGKDASRARRRRRAGVAHAGQHSTEHIGSAGQARRTEGGDAVSGKPRGDAPDGVGRIERVYAVHAMDVDVDEPWDDQMVLKIVTLGARVARPPTIDDLRDPAAFDDERAAGDDAIGQHDVGAG